MQDADRLLRFGHDHGGDLQRIQHFQRFAPGREGSAIVALVLVHRLHEFDFVVVVIALAGRRIDLATAFSPQLPAVFVRDDQAYVVRVEAGKAVIDETKKGAEKIKDAVVPESDARKIDVTLREHNIEMPRSISAGKTAFVVRNDGKERQNFKIEGQGLDKEFMIGVAPKLAPLSANGGTTDTELPQAGSPLIRAGGACQYLNASSVLVALTTDQRGMTRGNACDVGAVQAQAPVGSGAPLITGSAIVGGTLGCNVPSGAFTGDGK